MLKVDREGATPARCGEVEAELFYISVALVLKPNKSNMIIFM